MSEAGFGYFSRSSPGLEQALGDNRNTSLQHPSRAKQLGLSVLPICCSAVVDPLLLLGSWTTFSFWDHGPYSLPGKNGDTSAAPTELLHDMKNIGNCSCSLSSHFKTLYYLLYVCMYFG